MTDARFSCSALSPSTRCSTTFGSGAPVFDTEKISSCLERFLRPCVTKDTLRGAAPNMGSSSSSSSFPAPTALLAAKRSHRTALRTSIGLSTRRLSLEPASASFCSVNFAAPFLPRATPLHARLASLGIHKHAHSLSGSFNRSHPRTMIASFAQYMNRHSHHCFARARAFLSPSLSLSGFHRRPEQIDEAPRPHARLNENSPPAYNQI